MTEKFSRKYLHSLPLNERLRYLREITEIPQREVAELLHVDRSTYTYYETGKTEPRISSIIALARLYEITLDDLLTGL